MKIENMNINEIIKFKDIIIKYLTEIFEENFQISGNVAESIAKEKWQQLKEKLSDDNALFIGCLLHDELIGFAWVYKREYFDRTRIHINQLIVSRQYRGKGIAKQIINEIERIAKDLKIFEIDLLVTESNVEAINFYSKAGYLTERKILFKILDGGQKC